MESATNLLSSSSIVPRRCSLLNYNRGFKENSLFCGFKFTSKRQLNGDLSWSGPRQVVSCAVDDVHKQRSNLEPLFCYNKAIPEEVIEKPIGLALAEKDIGDNTSCPNCSTKGAVLCCTCSGSGLYIDSILESQGVIVKVRCLGCGGTGNILCSECGGRGHL